MDGFVPGKIANNSTSALKSVAAQDGWSLESGETTNMGGPINSAAATFSLGDNAQKKQFRSILSFNTKFLPDFATITKVTLKVKKHSIVGGGNPVNAFQGFKIDIKKGFFGSAASLQASDFQVGANKSYGPFNPALSGGWYTFDLTLAKSYINTLATGGGVTQIRLRFKLDDNNNSTANILKLYSGNAPVASRPLLIVEYTAAEPVSPAFFPVGPGGSDVIPHQIVRTNNDFLYIFVNQQSSAVLRVYRTKSAGYPESATDFAAPIQFTESSNPISVDAVYNGGNIIHVLINTKNGQIKDYPFDVSTNTFKPSITLATNGGTVGSGLYIGTSGISGMIDLNGILHVAYWTNGNHILHRSYAYNSSSNALNPQDDFFQVDTAGGANHPALAVSPADNSLTIAWVSQADNPTKIRARTRASNGTWGNVQSASTAPVWTSSDNGINIDQGPSLLIDSNGTGHLAYIQSFDPTAGDYGRIHYVTKSGSNWVDQALNVFSHDPAVAINGSGQIYIIGHGHPKNVSCLSMDDICTVKKNSNGTWANPLLFASPPVGSFDSSPSVKWSVVGFNRPETFEFIFFRTPYDSPTVYYARFQN
jgi:hypothetical protein